MPGGIFVVTQFFHITSRFRTLIFEFDAVFHHKSVSKKCVLVQSSFYEIFYEFNYCTLNSYDIFLQKKIMDINKNNSTFSRRACRQNNHYNGNGCGKELLFIFASSCIGLAALYFRSCLKKALLTMKQKII